MSGTTSRYALPYPTGSDGPNGASQIQALAQAVENNLPQQWVALGTGGASYSYGLTSSWTNLPGMSGSVTVPNGHTLDVEFRAQGLNIPSGGISYAQLLFGGTVMDIGTYSVGSGSLWVPIRLSGSTVGTGGSVSIAVQGQAATGSATVNGSSAGTVLLRYRIV